MRRPPAFTLVEIIVVVVVLGILAAVAVPKFVNAQKDTGVGATAADLKAFELALDMYHATHASYPPEVAAATAVPQLAGFLKNDAAFTKVCPIGGVYDYDAPAGADPAQINIRASGANAFTAASALALDDHFDDGNLATGRLREVDASRLRYLITPD